VVLPHFSQANSLAFTLASLLEKEVDYRRYEILVIDKHPFDADARGIVAKMRQKFPEATLLYLRQFQNENPDYLGQAEIKNLAVRLAAGRFIFFSNAAIAPNKTTPIGLPLKKDIRQDRFDSAGKGSAKSHHAEMAGLPREIIRRLDGLKERFEEWHQGKFLLAKTSNRLYSNVLIPNSEKRSRRFPNQNESIPVPVQNPMAANTGTKALARVNQGSFCPRLVPIPAHLLEGTLVIEANDNTKVLTKKLEHWYFAKDSEKYEIIVVAPERCRTAIEALIFRRFRALSCIFLPDYEIIVVAPERCRTAIEALIFRRFRALSCIFLPDNDRPLYTNRFIKNVRTKFLAYLPLQAPYADLEWRKPQPGVSGVQPWIPDRKMPLENSRPHPRIISAWMASTALIRRIHANKPMNYFALDRDVEIRHAVKSGHRKIKVVSPGKRVLALIPFFRCEAWLDRCLTSMENQTRSLDGIVVIDDASPLPPLSILARHPKVTLLRSKDNVGPYRLIQQVIRDTGYDAYLFQDADDWSSPKRLAALLAEAARTGASLIGCQEIRMLEEEKFALPVSYPLDVNQALAKRPGHPLLHPTSLVFRDLVMSVGGFSTGFRFGADTEFLLRAVHLGKVVNSSHYGYYRRHRSNSLTTAKTTGLNSPERKKMLKAITARANENLASVANGGLPNLTPLCLGPNIELDHLSGPKLIPSS